MEIKISFDAVVWSGELLPLVPGAIRAQVWHTCDLEYGEIGPPPAHLMGCMLMAAHCDPVAEVLRWQPTGLLPGVHVVIDRAPPHDTADTTL